MLVESTQQCCCDATEIKWICWVVEVVDVKKGGRKNIRVIEKNSGKTCHANLSENHNK